MKKWRLRAMIKSDVVAPIGKIEDKEFDLFLFAVGNNFSEHYRCCDIFTDALDIKEAFALLYERLNNFLDQYAMVSYGSVGIVEIVSIQNFSDKRGQKIMETSPLFLP